jgi:hypothetical protein
MNGLPTQGYHGQSFARKRRIERTAMPATRRLRLCRPAELPMRQFPETFAILQTLIAAYWFNDPEPAVTGRRTPPPSLRFEAFSGEVRKLARVQGRCARPIGTGERSNDALLRVTSISLCGRVIRCRCSLVVNATFGHERPISRAMLRAPRAPMGEKR